ncbi:acyl-CoA-binding domain-containing protein [Achlya hypogyna]|uniref:Acyl-CoA-binding domain-containing protein n=1 Tax=Achlya hypogyna TaxID=1202772 RepID=A0A1V9YDP3_ACHHY|nr:acyl-CoA-binding domain-containing protein [Achlya hypogyna]
MKWSWTEGVTTAAAVAVVAVGLRYLATSKARSSPRSTQSSGPKTDLDLHFEHAAAFVAAASKLSNENKLVLYAFFKQATQGDCTAAKPSAIEFVAKAKWDAWMGLQGMTKEEAQKRYLEVVSSVCKGYSYDAEIISSEISEDESSADGSTFSMGSATSQVLVDRTTKEWQVVENEYHAARNGNLDDIDAVLSQSPDALDRQDDDGRTMLHWAVDRAQTDVAASLIARGANVNLQDKEGMTPLHYAVLCEHIPLVDLLVQNGADISIADADGETPLAGASPAVKARMDKTKEVSE